MRPVNLIPPDLRRGEQAPLRTGGLVYVVLAALAALLVGVTALVLVGNTVSERKTEVSTLAAEDATATAKAEELAAYTQFQALSEQRVETVRSLAESRFDWERVMRELSLVLPSDVWLVSLSASAAPGVGVEGGGGGSSGLRGGAFGPALELNGCAKGQKAVAGFVSSLEDVDGVTRVAVGSSELPDPESGAGVSSSGEADSPETDEDCRTRKFISKFEIVVAFDAAPVPVTATTEPAPEEAAPEEAAPEEEGESTATSESETEG